VHIRSNLPELAALLQSLYAHYPLVADTAFADYHIALRRPLHWRRWWRPQVWFWIDHETPFAPFPQDTALPLLEWGLNWCVSNRAHQYLMLHAGVVEKQNKAVILPAWPNSGKSTLCAALAARGWRLLSDEFALVQPADLAIVPFPRLVSLKNESISVIRQFAPEAVMGPEYPKTRKGVVAHLRPPATSIARAHEPAQAAFVIFPNFAAGAALRLKSLSKARAFLKLSGNSFNYERIGLRGFETVSGLIEHCDCFLLRYSDLDQAVQQLDALVAGDA